MDVDSSHFPMHNKQFVFYYLLYTQVLSSICPHLAGRHWWDQQVYSQFLLSTWSGSPQYITSTVKQPVATLVYAFATGLWTSQQLIKLLNDLCTYKISLLNFCTHKHNWLILHQLQRIVIFCALDGFVRKWPIRNYYSDSVFLFFCLATMPSNETFHKVFVAEWNS